MKKILAGLAALFLLASPAYAQKTKAALTTEINTNFADNTTNGITAALLRTTTIDIVNAYVDWVVCAAQGGLVYWDGSATPAPTCLTAGTSGQLLKTQGAGANPVWVNIASQLTQGTGITISGSVNATVAITNTAVTLGTYGSATQCPTITVNQQGQLTGASATACTPPFSALTGQATLAQLPNMNASTVLANLTGGSAVPTAASPSSVFDLIGSTRGAVLERGASGWAIIAPGTSGLPFVSAGAGADPAYALLAATGGGTNNAFFQVTGPASTIKSYAFPNANATMTQTIASGAKALATSAISSATCTAAQTDTATGTLTTDAIIPAFNADPTAVTGYIPLTSGMLTIIYYPTADTVNFKVCNNTASSITPGAVTINWRVVR